VTPTGTFTATVWEKDHVSTKYGNAANTPWSKTALGGNAFGPYQLHMKELDSRGIYILQLEAAIRERVRSGYPRRCRRRLQSDRTD
jgi:hypothetical protein